VCSPGLTYANVRTRVKQARGRLCKSAPGPLYVEKASRLRWEYNEIQLGVLEPLDADTQGKLRERSDIVKSRHILDDASAR